MDKLIEDFEELKIGNKVIDISNISYDRRFKAKIIWNKTIEGMGDSFDVKKFDKMCDSLGLYLIRQDLNVLLRRMSLGQAIKQYVKRLTLTISYIRKSDIDEYNVWQEWVYYKVTGVKKKELERLDRMQRILIDIDKEIENLGIDPEQSKDVLLTLLQDQALPTKK